MSVEVFSWLPFSTTIREGGPFQCTDLGAASVMVALSLEVGGVEDEAKNRAELQEVSLSLNIKLNSFKIQLVGLNKP